MNRNWFHLGFLQEWSDATLLLMRVVVGAFLVWGVADNIFSAEHMRNFEQFLERFGFVYPAFMARLSVWAQFLVGIAFVTGFMTRLAGLVCAINFVVAIVMVDAAGGIRSAFPAASLVLIGLYLATYGAGRFGLDAWFARGPRHRPSDDDEAFRAAFEAGEVAPAQFDHAAHVRLGYIYLCGRSDDQAYAAMKRAIQEFLARLGVDPAKYHETITRAWILAIRHFMVSSPPCRSAAEFIERNPALLDTRIMLTHYSAGVLFSDVARGTFVEPDVDPIPRH